MREAVLEAKEAVIGAVQETWRRKLGFQYPASASRAERLWKEMEPLMRQSEADWITLWRQLAYVAGEAEGSSEAVLLQHLDAWSDTPGAHSAWYTPLAPSMREEWIKWIRRWRAALEEEGDRAGAQARMLRENPKFVPREWMLVEAYDAASRGDFSVVKQLHELLQDPYGEGTPELSATYYRTAPKAALSKGGTAFMT